MGRGPQVSCISGPCVLAIALHTTWRTIEDLEPYTIGRITPDRSLTVAVLNRRQAPPVDARRGATSDPSLDVAVNDNVSDDYNSLYFRDGTLALTFGGGSS